MQHPKHIVLSGATGFLGSHLLKGLLARRYAVTILKRATSDTKRIESEIEQVRVIDTDRVPLSQAFAGVSADAVIHTACSYGRQGESVVEMLETNVVFGLHLLKVARETGAQRFINTDTALPRTLNQYALSKKQLVDWLRFESGQPRVVNLRVDQMYGPDDDSNKFLPWVIEQLLTDAEEISFTKGQQKRDFIHVSDVVGLFMILLEHPLSRGFVEYDVGTGNLSTIRQVVETLRQLIAEIANAKNIPSLNFGALPYRAGELMEPEINVATTTRELGWQSRISLERGLREVLLERCSATEYDD